MDMPRYCRECGKVWEANPEELCCCGEPIDKYINHCHDKENNCLPFIECCEEHWRKCADDCHSECKCQNP